MTSFVLGCIESVVSRHLRLLELLLRLVEFLLLLSDDRVLLFDVFQALIFGRRLLVELTLR